LLSLLFLYLITFSYAHISFSFPTPRGTKNDIMAYPCGNFYFWDNDIYTTLTPGVNTIRVTEAMNHNGAPFRLAMSYDSDDSYDQLVLLDHIPHYDYQNPNANTSLFIDVVIPDISCQRCSIQIMSVVGGGCCEYPFANEGSETCGTVYHSCANIVITGATPVIDWAQKYHYTGPCGPYALESSQSSWFSFQDGFKYDPTVTVATQNTCSGFRKACYVAPIPTTSTSTSTSTSASASSSVPANSTQVQTTPVISTPSMTTTMSTQVPTTRTVPATSSSNTAHGTTHGVDFVPTFDFADEKEPWIIYVVLITVIVATIALMVYALLIRPKHVASRI